MACDVSRHSRSTQMLTHEETAIIKEFTNANIPMPGIRNVLKVKFPERRFRGKTITNCMGKIRQDGSNPLVNEAMELLKLLDEMNKEGGYTATEIHPITGQLTKAFWMNPEQRHLYSRYHDVVVNDTTYQTNRFGMYLNVTVVIDNAGSTRIVALALVSSEGATDYSWVLEHILSAGGGKPPGVIVVDEHTGMEVAIRNIFPSSQRVNCIWHIGHNFKKFNSRHFGNSSGLQKSFESLKYALTDPEFEAAWSRLTGECGKKKLKNKLIKEHLKSLYDNRFFWARPWTGTCFTAGVRSTQRVEKTHHLIKRLGNRKISLKELFQNVIDKTKDEAETRAYESYRHELKVEAAHMKGAKHCFRDIQQENQRYLGEFAQNEMKQEMALSYLYTYNVLQVRKFVSMRFFLFK